MLIIHIKRFYFDERRMDYRKIDEPLRFEKSIAINSKQNIRGKYDLYGIVHHYGTKNGGHYWSEVRDMHQPRTNAGESWYLCDDESVKGILEPELDSQSAYLLFYYKTTPNQKPTKK